MAVQMGLLRKVVQRIAANPDAWNQDSWAQRNECGTTFCLAGHTVMLAGLSPEWYPRHEAFWSEGAAFVINQYGVRAGIDDTAQELLGLTDSQATRLFYWGPAPLACLSPLDQLAARVRDVTGVDVSDAVEAGRREAEVREAGR